MKTPPNWFGRARGRVARLQRGSILLLTLFVASGLCLMIGVLLQATVTQERLNLRSALALEAKNAVETVTEYAISQIKLKFDNFPGITGNYFQGNPITIPSNISTFLWNGTDIDVSNVTLKIGIVPNLTVLFIDPSNPANAFDPDRGKNVTAGDVYVYAKATAKNQFGSTTAYAQQALEVRNNPLFTNAIFYNMDLEFHPGPAMSVTGPVHANGNIWAVAQTSLTFSGPVTSSGNFNVGMIPWPTSWGNSTESAQTGAVVYIPNSSGGYTSPYTGSGSQQVSSSYYDSRQTTFSNATYSNWREMSANLWGGNLQTSANGVPDEQVTGYNDFVYKANGTSQDLNYAYAIIEPAQNTTYTNGTANPYNLGTGENEKFERQASIIVKVLSTGTAAITTNTVVTGNFAVNATAIASNISTNEGYINTTVSTLSTSGSLAAGGGNMTITGNLVLSNGSTSNITGNTLTNPVSGTHPLSVPIVNQYQNRTSTISTGQQVGGNLMEVTHAAYNGTKTTFTTTRYVGVAYVEFNTLQSSVNATTNTLSPVFNTTTQQTDSYGDVTYPGDVIQQPIAVNGALINGAGALQNIVQFQPAIGNMAVANATVVASGNSSWISAGNASLVTGNTASLTMNNTSGVWTSSNTSDIWSGMYDQRRGEAISTINVDVGKLKLIVDNNATGYSTNSSAFFNGSGNTDFDPATQYNGVVYVEFPELPGNSTRLNSVTAGTTTYPGDGVLDSVDGTGLVLMNATSNSTSTGVPNPNYANTTIGQAGRVNGFTVATNNCVYILGNYNADGNLSTPAADTAGNQQTNDTMPDNVNNPDPVCCIAGDSVTALSGNWLYRNSGQAYGNLNASATEVNTAILGGIVPSQKYTSTEESGGSHNFPRFLEDWSGGVVFRYRGSMVCLYESEIANQTWSTNYYSPPNREWGFYNQFAKGIYPPGTPSSRSYYRVNFSYITQAQYNTATAGL